MKRQKRNNKWLQVFLHIIVWGFIIALPFITENWHSRQAPDFDVRRQLEFFTLNMYSYCFWIGTFYLFSYLLIPRFFNRKNIGFFILSFILVFFLIMIAHFLLFKAIITSAPFILVHSIRFNLPAYLFDVAMSISFRMILDKFENDKLLLQKQQENLKTELSFLRSQISPHFILNVLNNIVALNRLKSNDLEPTLMKLSGLMQYILYETDEEKISLKSETDYLQSYIDLQQQRFGNKVKVQTQIVVNDEWCEIEPMLLIPFVENAFKHGVGMIDNPSIRISLHVDENNVLDFSVINNYSPFSTETKDKTSGIGLANVERRLNILYGNRHSLFISKENNIFEVKLILKLNTKNA